MGIPMCVICLKIRSNPKVERLTTMHCIITNTSITSIKKVSFFIVLCVEYLDVVYSETFITSFNLCKTNQKLGTEILCAISFYALVFILF